MMPIVKAPTNYAQSQSLNTNQGHSDDFPNPQNALVAWKSQSLNTNQGNSDSRHCFTPTSTPSTCGLNPSIPIRAIRTPLSDLDLPAVWLVSIPQYQSGQFGHPINAETVMGPKQ